MFGLIEFSFIFGIVYYDCWLLVGCLGLFVDLGFGWCWVWYLCLVMDLFVSVAWFVVCVCFCWFKWLGLFAICVLVWVCLLMVFCLLFIDLWVGVIAFGWF